MRRRTAYSALNRKPTPRTVAIRRSPSWVLLVRPAASSAAMASFRRSHDMCMSSVLEVFDSGPFHTSERISSRVTTCPARLHQHPQQLELLVRQLHLAPVHGDQPRAQVHPHAVDLERLRHPAAQQRADPGQQLGQPERLGHVVVGARVQADDEVDLVGAGGQHQHGQLGAVGAQAPADLQAVHAGQPEVEHEQVDSLGGGGVEHRRAVGDDVDLVSLTFEGAGERFGDGRIVFGK